MANLARQWLADKGIDYHEPTPEELEESLCRYIADLPDQAARRRFRAEMGRHHDPAFVARIYRRAKAIYLERRR